MSKLLRITTLHVKLVDGNLYCKCGCAVRWFTRTENPAGLLCYLCHNCNEGAVYMHSCEGSPVKPMLRRSGEGFEKIILPVEDQ